MTTIQEIERAIAALPVQERDEVFTWMEELYAQQVDAGLQRVIESGAMDDLISQAIADHESGNSREF